MKRHPIYSLTALIGLCLAACSEGALTPETSVCDANYIQTCSPDLTGTLHCNLGNGSLEFTMCPNGCDPLTNNCKMDSCTPETYPQTCLNETTLAICQNNVKTTKTCNAGQTCKDNACVASDTCTETDYPPTCLDPQTRGFCYLGQKATQTCAEGCEAGACKITQTEQPPENQEQPSNPNPPEDQEHPSTPTPVDPNACDSNTFTTRCDTPEYVLSCVDNKLVRTKCTNGQMCNSELKNKTCKTPAYNDPCNPNTFSEMCYGDTEARICDEDTHKVITVNCAKDYDKDYKCDIKENFYGAGMDVIMCYSKAEACHSEGEESYEYCYADDSTGYRHFYKETYLCTEFNTGFHTYYYDIEECSETKCGQNAIRHPCNFELDY